MEDNARLIAEEIQQINAEIQQQIFGQKSIVSDSTNTPEATEAFTELMTKIMNDVRQKIDEEINKQAEQGKTEAEIIEHITQTIEAYQDTTIPQKMDMLATHFNGKLSELEQREEGYTHYIWHSQDDEKVRPDHAANDGQIFAWDNPPPTGHPGEDYNCRCYAEPAFKDPPIEPVYPELIIIPAARAGKIVRAGMKKIGKAVRRVFKKGPDPKDILNPNGKPIGKQGRRPEVREQKGGMKGADNLYDSFGKGKADKPKGYPGEGKRLPNGDWVGKRPKSKSGDPAIDLDVKDFPYNKIHFPD